MMAPGSRVRSAGDEQDGLLGDDGDPPQEVTVLQKICGPLSNEYCAWERNQREQYWAERALHLYPPRGRLRGPLGRRRSPPESAVEEAHRQECAMILERPPNYKEGHICSSTFQAIVQGLVSVAAYYAVVDQLASIKPLDFKPCNGYHGNCIYMRLIGSGSVPGSGPYFMQVENGVDAPITTDPSFMAYLVKHDKDINATAKESGNVSDAYAREVETKYTRSMQSAYAGLEAESNKSKSLRQSLFALPMYRISKMSFIMAMWPLVQAAEIPARTYGEQNIPSGICPGKTPEEMREFCDRPETRKKIQSCHLFTGMSRIVIAISLGGWGLLRCTHDILLIYGFSEKMTLLVHQFAALFQGIALASLFCRYMGALGVFATGELGVWDEGDRRRPCVCYYQLPDLEAVLALGTPFLLFATFAAKIQTLGRAALYGDYMTMSLYHVPHYLARRSMLWTSGTMISPTVSGTRQIVAGEEREKMSSADYKSLLNIQLNLGYLRMMVYFFVSLAACPFMVRLQEVMIGLYTSEGATLFKKGVVKYIFMLMPTIVTWAMGLEMLYAIFETCFGTFPQMLRCKWSSRDNRPEEGFQPVEDEPGFLLNVEPLVFDWLLERQDALALTWQRPGCVNILAFISWFGCSWFVLVNMIVVGQGLCPETEFLFSPLDDSEPINASICRAEVVGACSLIFMFVFVQRALSIVYPINEEIAMLRKLSSIMDEKDTHFGRPIYKPWVRCLLKDKVEEPRGAATA